MTHAQTENEKKPPLYLKVILGIVAAIIGLVTFVTIIEKINGASKPQEASPSETQSGAIAVSDSQEEPPIEVLNLSTDGVLFVTASFPVANAFSNSGILRNIQEGCVEALKEIQAQTEAWWDYDTLQCSGMSNWSENHVQVGSANFTGAQLAEISLTDIDPASLWEQGDTVLMPELQ